MKKFLICLMVLFLAVTAVAFAGRTEIDNAIKAYEDVVVEAERIANLPLVNSNDITALEDKAKNAVSLIDNVKEEVEFTIEDAKRSAELNGRFNKAMVIVITQKLLKH
ncbi:MAG: hypothetical protein LBH16_10705 [Treponema sp.]|jgi:hypothetical protein|nr:hypothetical protein [Treponema sp.]